jgi:hypothetical protein
MSSLNLIVGILGFLILFFLLQERRQRQEIQSQFDKELSQMRDNVRQREIEIEAYRRTSNDAQFEAEEKARLAVSAMKSVELERDTLLNEIQVLEFFLSISRLSLYLEMIFHCISEKSPAML